jgi:transposase
MVRRHELTDQAWAEIAPLLPEVPDGTWGALLRCAAPGQNEVISPARDQIATTSSSNATATRRLVGSSTASS